MERPEKRPEQPQIGPIEQAAKTLGVPFEKLDNPSIRTFLAFYCQLERMREQMGREYVYAPQWFTEQEREQEVESYAAGRMSSTSNRGKSARGGHSI